MKSLGKKIKETRNRKRISLSEMARVTGISKSNLSGIENCEDPNPTIDTLIKIAKVLGVCVGYIVDEKFDPADRERQFLKNLGKLSFKDRFRVEQLTALWGAELANDDTR
jgi:transcriptional regulator with XRE-family HTH domain